MPIRPENRDRYPADWPEISRAVKDAAGWRCECTGECGRPDVHLAPDGRCWNEHGQPNALTGARVVLTTAHLDHTPENCARSNLRAFCQGCHLHYDRDHHAQTRQRSLAALRGMEPLWGTDSVAGWLLPAVRRDGTPQRHHQSRRQHAGRQPEHAHHATPLTPVGAP